MSQVGKYMAKTALPCFLSVMTLLVLPSWGGDNEKDEDTLKNEANVLQEMLNSNSNSAPADVLAKADCVIVKEAPPSDTPANSTLDRPDANQRLYGKPISASEIVRGSGVQAPAAG
jgi:hypothetical protein